jgi:hypothetical protein
MNLLPRPLGADPAPQVAGKCAFALSLYFQNFIDIGKSVKAAV